MELKPGYKLTEVGVIPEDWGISALSDYSRRITDSEHLTPKRSATGFYLLSARNILNGRIDLSDVDYVGVAEYTRIRQRCNPETGDVLISCSGTVGRVAIVPEAMECVMVRSAALVKPDFAKLSGRYLQYFLQSAAGQNQIAASLNQGAQANLFLNHIQGLRIPAPPTKTEQEAIAEALSDADALIESLEQLITKKRNLKQGAMQELLTGRKRLPGFTESWAMESLGNLFAFKNGLNKGKEFFGYGTPIVNYMDVFANRGILCSTVIGRVFLTNQEILTFDLKKGDVLFTRTSETPEEIGMASVILDEPIRTVFSGFVLRGRPKDQKLLDSFKTHCLRSDFVRKQIVSKASYTTRALTNGRLLSAVLLPIPPGNEQNAIAAILTDMDAEIATLEAKLAKARQIKKGMMHNLLTGKIRLLANIA